jgi:NAD+ kinase
MSGLDAFQSVALLGNPAQGRVAECLLTLVAHLSDRGLRVLVDAESTLRFPEGSTTFCEEGRFAEEADILIAVGGDGTLLRAAHAIAGRPIPLLGINQGRLGFLTDISPGSMREDVDRILAGHYIEDRRALLQAQVEREGAASGALSGFALNDVVVQKAGQGRILEFETFIDGQFVNAHRGDGLVVATATGSTAYALSCGGPIVVPDLDALVLTPVCPHTLSDRPLMVRSDRVVEVRLAPDSGEVHVCCDGILIGNLTYCDHLVIRQSSMQVRLLHPPDYDYYRLLRSKLHWGRGESNAHQPAGPHAGSTRSLARASIEGIV